MSATTAENRIAELEAALAAAGSALAQGQTALEAQRAALAATEDRLAKVTAERDLLRASHERLRLELELLRRRIFVAKAERVDTAQLEMEFAEKLAALDRLGGGPPPAVVADESERRKPTGRRDLRGLKLPVVRVETLDPILEKLVAEGKAERFGFEESRKVAWQRGGARMLVHARAKYRVVDASGESMIETTPVPPECFPRSLAAPSLLAHILTDKFCDGLPLHRIEDRLARDGFPLDRGTMSRWVEDAGATAGATVVAAARAEAWRTAFCIATDATGIPVQPEPREDGKRQACHRGHYFVQIADRDHVFFEYARKETSATLVEMFAGYAGYIQADAKSVYDVLFREPDEPPEDETGKKVEVGCWSHARRKFWEATCTKSEVAREGLGRIGYMFALEDGWRREPSDAILRARRQYLRPHLEDFFAWAEVEHERVRDQRGLVRSALGYALRQKDALMRVLADGRLHLENNRSERELRRVAVGRKAWLFVGSHDHGEAAGHILSLVASARLHGLDPESYLRDVFRVLAHWPRDRHLELAPKYWAQTRARLDPAELGVEIGTLTVPPPLPSAAGEQVAAD
jgi:transposase